ncbi:MAG: Glutamate/gamma-aminobutyrate antiporter [Candidatus Anoxychlamydiales bacterium]|nr:Glutamate/gamma-aminobutyrate antiporter [Candidatus Anoxychlamydiales bacterium]NGX52088.1 Glutamate/gamma-aminobutyrate antiporter [Candidatus Anoxychlamydiales bacterium]
MKKRKSMSLFYLIMVSSALVISIRNLPTIAASQFQMLFFGLVATIVFLIPSALVSAELATGWPKMGGIAVWTKEAFGKKWGLVASWLQWIYAIISVISMLFFVSASFAYIFDKNLADNKVYMLVSELVLIWAFTFINLKGLKISKIVSTVGYLVGVFFPAILIIILSVIYIWQGNPINLDLSLTKKNIFPDFSNISSLVLFIGFIRAVAGIEVSAAHANSVENPKKNYPIALFIVVVFVLIINILGSMAVAVVVPLNDLSLSAGVMEAFLHIFQKFKLTFFLPLIALLVAVGQAGGFSSWLLGPVKGLLVVAKDGELPPFFQKVNKNNVPVNLMIIQAIIISILGTFFLLFTSSIDVAFWISVALSMLIYAAMYILMYLSGLYLRYKKPNVKRSFKIPGKNFGIIIVSTIGIIAMALSFIIAFFPPAEFPTQQRKLYFSILIIGIIVVFALPFIINAFKKPHWIARKKDK